MILKINQLKYQIYIYINKKSFAVVCSCLQLFTVVYKIITVNINFLFSVNKMVAKQLSIFLENKSGRLTEVTEVLAKEGVNLSALCIAENADFGILRGIVSEPDKAYKALKDNHFAVNVTDVIGISCPNIPGSLAKVLRYLSDEGVFIEYMYSFANGNTANVIIRPNDMENCIRVLTERKVDLLAANDLYRL